MEAYRMDLGKTLTVEVTQDDIAAGKPEEALSCPIALAVCRQLGVNAELNADVGTVDVENNLWIHDEDISYVYPLPDEARDFIANFDIDGPVDPFKFTTGERATVDSDVAI